MNNFSFQNPTQLLFGEGEIRSVGKKVRAFGHHVLLVYGGGSIKKTGLYDQVMELLKNEGLQIWELAGVEPNPRLTTVKKGIEICKSHEINMVLAVGGGSVIDASKAIAMGACYEGDVWDFYTKNVKAESVLPIGVIVTHAATGSEMNGRSVITNWETGQKVATNQLLCYPKFSILDPTLTFTVPREQLIYGIVDIMSHVYEQYISATENTPLQDRLCEAVLATVIENATRALEKQDDYVSRANLMLSATFALNDLISLGMEHDWASHRIQYEVAAIYDIPHGGGLAIIMPHWMDYVYEDALDKFVRIATQVWRVNPRGKSDQDVAQEGIESLKTFFKEIGAPVRLAEYNVNPELIPEMAQKAVFRGTVGAIKKLGEDDVRTILERAF